MAGQGIEMTGHNFTDTRNDGPVYRIDGWTPQNRQCPYCMKLIRTDDDLCRWCQSEVDK